MYICCWMNQSLGLGEMEESESDEVASSSDEKVIENQSTGNSPSKPAKKPKIEELS